MFFYQNSILYDVLILKDGNFLYTGLFNHTNSFLFDKLYVFKTDCPLQTANCKSYIVDKLPDFYFWPKVYGEENKLIIKHSSFPLHIEVYDIMGRLVSRQTMNSSETRINNLSSGIYVYRTYVPKNTMLTSGKVWVK